MKRAERLVNVSQGGRARGRPNLLSVEKTQCTFCNCDIEWPGRIHRILKKGVSTMHATVRYVAALSMLTAILFAAGPTSAAFLYVSPFGNDTTGDGSPGSPFETTQAAHNAAAQGDTLIIERASDSGPVVINRSINIIGSTPGAGIYDPPGPCVTVNAPGRTVVLDNIVCDQSGDAQHGILINSAHKVNIVNSTIRGGTGAACGIFEQSNANTELNISDTNIGPFGTTTSGGGICIVPRSGADVNGAFDDLIIQNGRYGIRSTAGSGSNVQVIIDNATISGNTVGVSSNGTGSKLAIANSTISGNNTGLSRATGGQIVSGEDNIMIWNNGDGSFSSTKPKK